MLSLSAHPIVRTFRPWQISLLTQSSLTCSPSTPTPEGVPARIAHPLPVPRRPRRRRELLLIGVATTTRHSLIKPGGDVSPEIISSNLLYRATHTCVSNVHRLCRASRGGFGCSDFTGASRVPRTTLSLSLSPRTLYVCIPTCRSLKELRSRR